ncbi:hypothetical protein MMC06_005315 [Schaereria dolodes]|nr:hypothetical protein [Schaereria dolodes]
MQNHYEVLTLPSPSNREQTPNKHDIKLAYRHALLHHHPDKSRVKASPDSDSRKVTVDDISLAYKVLSNPASRSEYDRLLWIQASKTSPDIIQSHPGLETMDLDDLSYDEANRTWHRSCRCGNAGAFMVTEADLEKDADTGETFTGCGGCSLWLRVVFAKAEDA